MNRRLIMGTAGHIDHGKTSLIKLLTGYDCDRLPEEKARGITIELGFTHLELPGGSTLGIVDVPGHERFVRAMVAGAAGIDFVVLVIAADEAVMPQTREHLAVCRLLGIRDGLIALTKADLVDDEMLELAQADVADLVAGTFLEDAPMLAVSATTGQGRDELLAAIERVAQGARARSDSGIFRLPTDRVFTVKGFGTVVTGTCVGGQVAVGDEIGIWPAGRVARVRGLQVHDAAAQRAFAGQRTAVNLQNVEVAEAPRGSLLTTPDTLTPTMMIDVEVEMLAEAPRPLKRRSIVRVHQLTREVMARVVPMSAEQIEPGQTGIAQLRLTEPLLVLPGDRFVLRSYSPVMTVGGGVILASRPRKHRAPYDVALAELDRLRHGDVDEKMSVYYRLAGRAGLTLNELGPMLGVGAKSLRDQYQRLLSQRRLVRVDADSETAVDGDAFAAIESDLLTFLKEHHRQQPHQPGVSRAALLGGPTKGAGPKVMAKALSVLLAAEAVVHEGGVVRLPEHSVTADEDLQRTLDRLGDHARAAGLSGPTRKELLALADDAKLGEKALGMLLREGRLVRLGTDLHFDGEALAAAAATLEEYLREHEQIDAQGMKTLFGLSRKWSIPLAEHFDTARLTLRVGDKRMLRKRG